MGGEKKKNKIRIQRCLSHYSLKALTWPNHCNFRRDCSGKSTLVNLIFTIFLIPTEGRILIEWTRCKKINVRELRKHIAIVMQDVFLILRNNKENIALEHQN